MSAHILRGNFKHSFMMWFSRLYLYLYFEPTHLLWLNILLIHICQISAHVKLDCKSFVRRTFTTPKIRTFTTPKFGHFPPHPKKTFARRTTATPNFFLAHFSWLFRLTAHGGHQGWEGGGA